MLIGRPTLAEGTLKTRWETRLNVPIKIIHPYPIKQTYMTRSNTILASLVRLNCIRTGYGRFNYNMNLMGLSPSASCECGAATCKPDRSPHRQRVSSTQLQRGLGHIEHCRTHLASRPAVCFYTAHCSSRSQDKKIS